VSVYQKREITKTVITPIVKRQGFTIPNLTFYKDIVETSAGNITSNASRDAGNMIAYAIFAIERDVKYTTLNGENRMFPASLRSLWGPRVFSSLPSANKLQ
jgi:hypothetical protein